MYVSYKWLQSYFDKPLPEPEKLSDVLTFIAYEVEGMEKKGDDIIFDLKVLPDRACYALSHRGLAYDVAAALGVEKKVMAWPLPKISKVRPLTVTVEAKDLCARYVARVIENVTPKALPWVKEHLEGIGQRSINPVVDGANIVMFDMGQPLHAFDADKVEGGIVVRRARKGEKITTLDNRDVALDESTLIIADSKDPLAIAGIKGGKKAEVTASTKNLILESANFDASYIRRASERLGIRTDASKRFENRLTTESAQKGAEDFTAYLFEMDKGIKVGELVDSNLTLTAPRVITVSHKQILKSLGISLLVEDVIKILSRLEIFSAVSGDALTLTIPNFRLDLQIPEDITEEVGRIVGYDKVPAVLPPKWDKAVEISKNFYYEWKIREALVNAGFSEVMTSSFASTGDIAIEKPLAEDKKYTRGNLRGSFAHALSMNILNAPLFGKDETRIFEIGRVFSKEGEATALAIGYGGPKKKVSGELASAVKLAGDAVGQVISGETKDGVFEGCLDAVFTKLPEPKTWDIKIPAVHNEKFEQFSLYPFIVRDIALFVPSGTESAEVHKLILKEAGELVVRSWLFDKFEKPARPGEQGGEGKISYGFRLVFQASDRTLTDEEINSIMTKVYSAVAEKGWRVR